MTMVGSEPNVRVYTYDGTPRTDGLPDEPEYLGLLSQYSLTVLPDGERDLTLWFSADAAWTVSLAPLDVTPFADQVSSQDGSYLTYLHYVGPDEPFLARVSCLDPPDETSRHLSLTAYTPSAGYDTFPTIGCPGETTFWLETVPTVMSVLGKEWTLTLERPGVSSEPELSPEGEDDE